MTALRLLVLSCPVRLIGCGAGKGRLDGRTKTVLAEATKVEMFRLDGKEADSLDPPRPGKRLAGFLVTEQGPDQDGEFARKLLGILSDEKTYTDKFAKCFWPGVAFRVWREEECVEVLICFLCDNFYCGPPVKGRARENATFKDSPRRADLVRLAKEAFPDDKEIQAFKE
jgi:hypothetical protein